ncbi:MAG: hypothetical protein ACK5JO_11620 [Halodesulfovibrio sp.]
MHMEWNITKQRGNSRPVLTYTLTLTEYEIMLCLPAVRVESEIPRPPDSGWTYCWPNQNERSGKPLPERYLLMTPSHKTVTVTESVRLPWREDNSYPEVAASFTLLREAFEKELAAASASQPMQESGSLQTTAGTKRSIAPACAAERLLKVVGGPVRTQC